MSSLHLALYSFGSSITQTGSLSVIEQLELIENSGFFTFKFKSTYKKSPLLTTTNQLQGDLKQPRKLVFGALFFSIE
jgi:hypothetical protein